MEAETIIGSIAVIITVTTLLSASVQDWREREVSNFHWVIIGVSGLILFTVYSILETGFRIEYLAMAVGTALILVEILVDREFNSLLFYFLLAVLFIPSLYGNLSDPVMAAWAVIPISYILFMGMYIFDIVRGGADAKCLIVLSVMFPIYPAMFGMPLIEVSDTVMSQIFVFPIMVLFIAALAMIPIMFCFFVRNLIKGEFCKKAIQGYKMELSAARESKVWPIEDIKEGKRVSIGVPEDEKINEIYERMEAAGYDEVWVTPMIPFLIPITFAVIFLVVIGNPLFFIG